jgi:pyruvate kinase
MNIAEENNLLCAGDLVVTTAGTLQGVAGSTDLIKVELVQSVLGKGIGIGQGVVSGRARVASCARDINDFNPGEILVVPDTNADFVEVIRQAAGIVTEEGVSSHAAVIGLRLGIPVIVGFKDATKVIREGAFITLDSQKHLVYSGTTKR